jgi:chemotaxis protein CheX
MSENFDQEVVVNTVRRVTLEVFSTMLCLDMKPGESFTEVHASDGAEGVMSFVGLAGRCTGAGSLRCDSQTACRLAGAFLMSEFDSVNGDVLDAIGELTNMIIGNLKTHLEDQMGPISLSIPTVIHGRNFTARSSSREEWMVVPFQWEGGRLDVKVCLRFSDEESGHAGSRQEFVLHGAGARRSF